MSGVSDGQNSESDVKMEIFGWIVQAGLRSFGEALKEIFVNFGIVEFSVELIF